MTTAIMIHITTTDSAILIPPKMGIVNTVLTLNWSINSSTSPFVAVTSFFSLSSIFCFLLKNVFQSLQLVKRTFAIHFCYLLMNAASLLPSFILSRKKFPCKFYMPFTFHHFFLADVAISWLAAPAWMKNPYTSLCR